MSEVVHLRVSWDAPEVWCPTRSVDAPDTHHVEFATCLPCLLACAEYGSEARHRYEVLREQGVKP